MHHRVVRIVGFFLIILFYTTLSACFQVIEDVTVQSDGSGTMTLTANLSQSRTKLASVLLLDSVNGYKVPSQKDIQGKLAELANTLSEIPGISQVTHQVNFDTFIAVIKFRFEKVSDLNTVMATAFKELKVPSGNSNAYTYNPQKGVFERDYTYMPKAKEAFDKLKAADQAIFENAIYTSIYRFQKPVRAITNQDAKRSGSQKAVMLQTPIMGLIQGTQSLSNQIQLSN